MTSLQGDLILLKVTLFYWPHTDPRLYPLLLTIYYRIVIAKTCHFEHTQNNINATTTCMYLLGRPLYHPEFCTPLSQMTSRSRWNVNRNFSCLSGRALGKTRKVAIGWIVRDTTYTCDRMNLNGRDVFKVKPTQQNLLSFENERKR